MNCQEKYYFKEWLPKRGALSEADYYQRLIGKYS